MAAIAIASGALAGYQIASGYFAARNVKETARLNQDIADMNAEFALLDAHDAKIEGFTASTRYQKVIDDTLATQRAELAAADVDVNYGSVASIQEETRFLGDLNKQEIINQAQDRALGFERQARDYSLGGFLTQVDARARASAIQTRAIASAAQTGLTGYVRSR